MFKENSPEVNFVIFLIVVVKETIIRRQRKTEKQLRECYYACC